MHAFARKIRDFFLTAGRVLKLVWKGFVGDRCNLHSSALTYYTLMSIVPLLAFGLSLARVFGAGDLARDMISRKISDFCAELSKGSEGAVAPEATTQLVDNINQYASEIFDRVSDISFSTLGAVGLLALLWAAIAMLSNVEQSFNSVWHAPQRKLWRKISDYVTIIIVVPFLGIAASSIPIVAKITAFAEGCSSGFMSTELLARALRFGTTGLLMVALFTVVLVFVPNTKVKFGPGLVGGLVTAVAFAAWLKICATLQIGVAKYSKIYGGFAAMPILLAWTYVSWQIMLFGAELTLALQRHEAFLRDEGARNAGFAARALLALALVVEMARRMAAELKPLDVTAYTRGRGISDRLALDVVEALTAAGITAATPDENDGDSYVLIRSPEKLTVGETLAALGAHGAAPAELGLDNVDAAVRDHFAHLTGEQTPALAASVASLAEKCASTTTD